MATLNDGLVAGATRVSFTNGSAVNAYFQNQVDAHFVDWFNANCANKGFWAQKGLGSSADVKTRFKAIWDLIPDIFQSPSINLIQFSALMSILVNEVGQQLLPVTELVGNKSYPGLAYPFSTIAGLKRTYNSTPLNKLAGDLFFGDDTYWTAHQSLPLANAVRLRPDLQQAWNRDTYPTNFSTSTDHTVAGFIHEADFYKFRGRGFIQMTWRANYKRLVHYVQTYRGSQPTVTKYAALWAGKDADQVATASSNADWDELFQNSNLVVPSAAVGMHNQASGNYLALADDVSTLSVLADTPGSIYRMGLRISGGVSYATLFHDRVIQLLNTLDNSTSLEKAAGTPSNSSDQ